MRHSNTEKLIAAADRLRPVLNDLVFVGGAVAGLLVTDNGVGAPRITRDVDAIVGLTSYAEYATLGEKLRALGFSEDTSEKAPLCRWIHTDTILDVMPLEEKILGFSNRWYPAAMETATRHQVSDGLEIRLVTAPYFAATKLEAFHGRGGMDYLASHDLADMIFMIDGRATIVEEVRVEPAGLRNYFRTQIEDLLATPAFMDALPGYVLPDAANQARMEKVIQRLKALASDDVRPAPL